MRKAIKKILLFCIIGIAITGCKVPETEKKDARDTVIKYHIRKTLNNYKAKLEQDKFIAMPELLQSIEMRECDIYIDLNEDKISYIPKFFSNVNEPYYYDGVIKHNQKYDDCVISKLLKTRVPDKYLNNFAFSLYRENITSVDYQGLVKKINADGVITYAEAIELYNFIYKNEVEKRSKESWSDSLARWFNEK
jgi:hypothetical protein